MGQFPRNRPPKLPGLMVVGVVWLSAAQLFGEPSARNACASNLRHISSASQQWAIVYRIPATNAFPLQDTNVWRFITGGTLPVCPDGGTYDAGRRLTAEPVCSIHGTLLDVDRRDARWRLVSQIVRIRYLAALGIVTVTGFVLLHFRRGAGLRRRRTSVLP